MLTNDIYYNIVMVIISKEDIMTENIKFYPISYVMSDKLKSFFTAITNDFKLQEQLYATKKLSDVVIIANKLGFNIKGAEVLQAQAGRVLAIIIEQSDDVENLLSGLKPRTSAQWGRGGGGFLDKAGFWLNELSSVFPITPIEAQINKFLDKSRQNHQLKKQLLAVKTFNELAALFQENDFNLTAINLLTHQAQKILALSEAEAERVADN
ncbi:MAG: hypothetical protein K0R94_611 [Burkholderiales bacterium]|jgi:predicted ribosomally synthesized peptide with nif11-like leader|nr:hypothetical protein [Burkholderiales bacterium]